MEPLRIKEQINRENTRGFEVAQDSQDISKTDNATETEQRDGKTATTEKRSSLDHSNEKDDFSLAKQEYVKNNAAKWRFAACVLNRVFFVLFVCSSLLSSLSIFLSVFLGGN